MIVLRKLDNRSYYTEDAPVIVSGTGNIYCGDLYLDNSIRLSSDEDDGLLINGVPIPGTFTGYTGAVPFVASITTDGTVTNSYMIFENGILTTVSGGTQTSIDIPDYLLSVT